MNSMFAVVALVATLTWGEGARAEDLGFRWDEATGRCLRDGVEGRNPGHVGQCGDLTRIYLFGRDLRNADLRGALLFRANLTRANLAGADLRGAALAGAYLHKAKLRGADLRGAIFCPKRRGAELARVDFEGARFDESTVLPFSPRKALARRMVFEKKGLRAERR